MSVGANHHYTTRDVTKIPNVSKSNVENHLKALGCVSKLDVWIPHQLEEIHSIKRITTCDSLLKREENDPFLKRMITNDEKWIVYSNIERRRSWSKCDEPAQNTLSGSTDKHTKLEIDFNRNYKIHIFNSHTLFQLSYSATLKSRVYSTLD